MAKEVSAPIKWHGGKTYLASRILELMPEHVHYVEPFFGGGAVLFRKSAPLIEKHSEVVNDIYGDLINFWKVLQSKEHFPEFERMVAMTPFAEPVWKEACADQSEEPVARAVAFFVQYRQSRQGLGKAFATMSRSRTRRGMNEQVSSWISAIEGLPEAHERLRRVVIFNEQAAKLIRREDDPHTFFYCDPPYLSETRAVKNAYSHEMSEAEHLELIETLGSIQGKFLLSGYPHPMYKMAEIRFGWRCEEISIDNKASSAKIKPIKTECLWMNF